MTELVMTIDGCGQVNVWEVKEDIVDEFVNDKAESGYLVSVIKNAEKTLSNGLIKVCFTIHKGELVK